MALLEHTLWLYLNMKLEGATTWAHHNQSCLLATYTPSIGITSLCVLLQLCKALAQTCIPCGPLKLVRKLVIIWWDILTSTPTWQVLYTRNLYPSIQSPVVLLWYTLVLHYQSSSWWSSFEFSSYSHQFISSSVDLGTTSSRAPEWDHSRICDQCNSLGEWGALSVEVY